MILISDVVNACFPIIDIKDPEEPLSQQISVNFTAIKALATADTDACWHTSVALAVRLLEVSTNPLEELSYALIQLLTVAGASNAAAWARNEIRNTTDGF